MSDDLSRDMLAPSWPNLVYLNFIVIETFQLTFMIWQESLKNDTITTTYSVTTKGMLVFLPLFHE